MWVMAQSGSAAKLFITELPRPRTPMQATLILLLGAFAPDRMPLGRTTNPIPVAAVDFRNWRR